MQRSGVWADDGILPRHVAQPLSVKHAGFKGFVGDSETHDYHKEVAHDQGQFLDPVEDTPDHIDDHLSHFAREHGSREDWEKGGGKIMHVDLRPGVYATQSHVSQFHINRYLHAPNDKAWYLHSEPDAHDDGYIGHGHPLFVTHQGRLHAIEGHHRIGADLAKGQTHSLAWHFDLDKHPVNYLGDIHKDENGINYWGPGNEKCPDCEHHLRAAH